MEEERIYIRFIVGRAWCVGVGWLSIFFTFCFCWGVVLKESGVAIFSGSVFGYLVCMEREVFWSEIIRGFLDVDKRFGWLDRGLEGIKLED